MAGPTVAEVKAVSPPSESLWQFLSQLPGTMEAQILYGLILGCAVGMISHYLRRWSAGEIEGNLIDYMFKDNPRRSFLAVFGIVTWSVGEVATGIFVNDAGTFVGWAIVLLMGWKTGYTGDSLGNKADRPVWTDEQRKQERVSVAVTGAPAVLTPQPSTKEPGT